MPTRAAPLALLALAMACGGSPTDRPLDAAATWQIDTTPILAIGRENSDTAAPLGNAVAAYAMPDGGVVVADMGYTSIRYFDAQGTFVRQAGREGDGPGEFRYLGRMLRCGDTLHAQELQRREVLVYSREGEFVRSVPLTGPDSRFNLPYQAACGPTGRLVANGWDTVRVREYSRVRGTVPYWLGDADWDVTRVLGSWPGSERLSGPDGSSPHPLGKEPVLAVGRDRVYVGLADSFAINVYALDGTPLPPIVKQRVDLATTEVDIARYQLLDTLGRPPEELDWRVRRWERFTFPPTVPAYTALLVDRDDNLWVRTFPRSAANLVRWVVFDPAGREIGAIDLPVTLQVFDVGSDEILGIEVALDDGRQQVVKYRWHRGAT